MSLKKYLSDNRLIFCFNDPLKEGLSNVMLTTSLLYFCHDITTAFDGKSHHLKYIYLSNADVLNSDKS